MKHTSINLSKEHLGQIAKTRKSPTAIIRDALDRYFNPGPEMSELIREHERRYHMPENAHNSRMDMRKIEHEERIQEPITEDAPHSISEKMPENAHNLSMKALAYILAELKAGREPVLPDVADALSTTKQKLAKSLSPLGIRAQETKRAGIAGRYFTQAMKRQIEEILGKV